MSIADRTWDHLPPEIHSRIMAATAHAQIRRIEHHDPADPALPEGVWTVDAIAGDRFVHQVLALRADGSVSEETRTALAEDVVSVSFEADGATVILPGPAGPESVAVPEPIGRALDHHGEEGLERAVKGVGQGIAGRLKELAGEFLDDPDLHRAGIEQQREAEMRRADGDPPA